ncbi:hypothetical protein GCM10009127_09660 [Alteraurantiacibacter aestuarii]|uniref:Uncharacterized protein n=1 Tax=Alteraurantiacibacter aestuarii TaxID=650004 RepID=A0A844ZHP9_9SPHN|nr:hypothetical protein [Alteraurantiacibacter aestuarii]MXO87355.1 hypothetical protein [Alteraurantiacibacter aestuarii]
MLHKFLLALAVLLLPVSALAQGIEGNWDLRSGDTTIFRFTIAEGDGGEWSGTWQRPASFNTDGNAFARLSGGVEDVPSMTGIEFLERVELSFDDPRPGAIPDIFRFELIDEGHVRMTYVGTDLEPYLLVRSGENDPMGDWDITAIYRRTLPASAADGDIRVRSNQPALELRSARPSAAPPPPPADEPVAAAEQEDEAPQVEEPETRIGSDFLEGF